MKSEGFEDQDTYENKREAVNTFKYNAAEKKEMSEKGSSIQNFTMES